ncbi:hypothetical protein V7S43_017460 [Phytophthora oleae]|uniref:RXLR phytopathogen effector protein WY-domain domain-containing protein n=1 Tax=Phytophthora oleae TaxID=2107226 RepID=A0ABD3ET23_9STRA
MLRLNKAGDSLLSNPKFALWTQYSDDFYVKFPDEGITMLRTLSGYYDDIFLAKMIEAALKTTSAAKRVEGELFKKWLVGSYPPEFIFTSLELQRAGKTLLENPLLNTWSRYVVDFNKHNNNSAKKVSVSKILTEFYNKDELLQTIALAKKDASTEKLATDLGRALLNST